MNSKLLLCLALGLSSLLTGCVTHREFRGSTANLGGEEQTAPTNFLKVKVAGSGVTTNAGNYLVLSLPSQNCQLAFFYPKLKPFRYDLVEAEINSNHTHAQQVEQGMRGTNYVCITVDLPEKQTGVWLVRRNNSTLHNFELGPMGNLPAGAERLYGQFEWSKDGSAFGINADLASEDGVKISGIFDSYKELWYPLALPGILIFGPGGPSWEHKYKPLPRLHQPNDTVDTNSLKAIVEPSKTEVRIGEHFNLALRIENLTATNQSVQAWSCSWDQNWQINNSSIVIDRSRICEFNPPLIEKIPPGGSIKYDLKVYVPGPIGLLPSKKLSFKMGFTPIGSQETFWSNKAMVNVVP